MDTKIIQGTTPIFSTEELNKIRALWIESDIVNKHNNDRNYSSVYCNNPPPWVIERTLKWFEDTTQEKFHNYNLDLILHKFSIKDYFTKHQDNVFRKKGFRNILIGMSLNDAYQGGEFLVYNEDSSTVKVGENPGTPYIIDTSLFHEITPVTYGVRESLVVFTYDRDFVGIEPKINLL